MTLSFPYKDPDEYLDYTIDWSARLGTDTILTSTWSTPSPTGITMATYSITTYTAIVWVSGGTVGNTYQFTNRITTAAGRIMDQTCKLKIKVK